MKIFIFLFFLLSGLGTFAAMTFKKNENQKPNIVLIFADDMGYGDVSYLNSEGRVFTPHIDNMARKGILFSDAHAGASVCTPSRYALLTGRYAWRSTSAERVVNGFARPVIEEERSTLASLFKNKGYATACVGKWHLGLEWQTDEDEKEVGFDPETGYSNLDFSKRVTVGPNDFGFDYSYIHPASLDMPPYVFLRNHQTIDPQVVLTSEIYPEKLKDTEYHWDRKHTNEGDVYWDKMVWWRRGEISKSFRVENCLNEIMEDGKEFISNHVKESPSSPFFLYLPLTGPHSPWLPTEEFKGKSSIGTYGDFMMNIDHVVGQISQTLIQMGVYENTILIFASDNGAYWPQSEIDLHKHKANGNRKGQKGDIWEGGHRIPLIISWPARIQEPKVFDKLVSLTDFYATFAELTGQDIPSHTAEDSFSFLPVLHGDLDKPTRTSMIHQSSDGMFGIRTGDWKLIDGLGSGGFTAPSQEDPEQGGPGGQLYHLKQDSLETKNLYLQHPDIVNKLQKELTRQIEGVK